MKIQISKVLDILIRSIIYIIINYVFISMELSFRTHWFSILFMATIIWATIDYRNFIKELTEKKFVAEILCICCITVSSLIAFFVGYIQGTAVSF